MFRSTIISEINKIKFITLTIHNYNYKVLQKFYSSPFLIIDKVLQSICMYQILRPWLKQLCFCVQ